MKMFSIRDKKAGVFIGPFFVRHEVDAVRRCVSALQDEKTTLAQYPEDYDLVFLGDFNDETGNMNQEGMALISTFIALKAQMPGKAQNVSA